jgi:hypothetical protein
MPESYGQLHTFLFPAADAPRRGNFSAPSGVGAGLKAASGGAGLGSNDIHNVKMLQSIQKSILSEKGGELNFFWLAIESDIHITINYNKKNKL